MLEKFCKTNCIYLSCDEKLQNFYYSKNKEKPPHMCRKYEKRLYHWGCHPFICKCEECLKEGKDI